MKAEHRKELQTNVLADTMGKFVQGMRSGSQTSSNTVWVIVGIAAVTFFAWYFTSGTSGSRSAMWVQLDDDAFVKEPNASLKDDLERIIKESPSSMAGRTARFQSARLLLPFGLQNLCTEQRKLAINNLRDAREMYLQLATECMDDSLLRQEALMGAAKAEEALVGVPKDDKEGETYGSLDEALKLYRKLGESYPESFLGKQAAAHVREIENNRPDVEKFYAELSKLAGSVTASELKQ